MISNAIANRNRIIFQSDHKMQRR